MKTGDIIQSIESLYSKGVQSDDSRLTPRHIYNKMLRVRSRIIVQQANKKQKIGQSNFQSLPCIEVIKVSRADCPCIPPIGCSILRSKYKIPKILVDSNKHIIQYVTTVAGNIVFDEGTWSSLRIQKFRKYTSNKSIYILENEYLYLIVNDNKLRHVKVVKMSALFDDPFEAMKFTSYCNEDCTDCDDCSTPLDMDFPLDAGLYDNLTDMCKVELIEQFSAMKEDLTNNTRDNNIEESK